MDGCLKSCSTSGCGVHKYSAHTQHYATMMRKPYQPVRNMQLWNAWFFQARDFRIIWKAFRMRLFPLLSSLAGNGWNISTWMIWWILHRCGCIRCQFLTVTLHGGLGLRKARNLQTSTNHTVKKGYMLFVYGLQPLFFNLCNNQFAEFTVKLIDVIGRFKCATRFENMLLFVCQ